MLTISEQIFEEYLNGRKIGFEREKGSIVHPDYWLGIPTHTICEVHEIDPPPPSVTFVSTNDPFKKLRKALQGKVRQGKEAKDQKKPYVVVLCNKSFAVSTSRFVVEGAMYGNISFVYNLFDDPKKRAEHVGNFFVEKGSLRYARNMKDKGIPVKTRISAVAILEKHNPTQAFFDAEADKILKDVPVDDIDERLRLVDELANKLRKEGKYSDTTVSRVRVFHNFYAANPLGFDVFTGEHDEQYYIDPETGGSKEYQK